MFSWNWGLVCKAFPVPLECQGRCEIEKPIAENMQMRWRQRSRFNVCEICGKFSHGEGGGGVDGREGGVRGGILAE